MYQIDFSTKVGNRRGGGACGGPADSVCAHRVNLATGAQPLRLGAASLAPTLNGVVLPEGKATIAIGMA